MDIVFKRVNIFLIFGDHLISFSVHHSFNFLLLIISVWNRFVFVLLNIILIVCFYKFLCHHLLGLLKLSFWILLAWTAIDQIVWFLKIISELSLSMSKFTRLTKWASIFCLKVLAEFSFNIIWRDFSIYMRSLQRLILMVLNIWLTELFLILLISVKGLSRLIWVISQFSKLICFFLCHIKMYFILRQWVFFIFTLRFIFKFFFLSIFNLVYLFVKLIQCFIIASRLFIFRSIVLVVRI